MDNLDRVAVEAGLTGDMAVGVAVDKIRTLGWDLSEIGGKLNENFPPAHTLVPSPRAL